MICEILSVGTEILLGEILNTNAQYLARKMAELGIFVYYQTVVGDNPDRLKKALEIAFERSDMVIATGGLGPTKDDITKEVAREYFNEELVLHEETLKKLYEIFKSRNLPLTEGNKKQAYIIKGSMILPNDFGTAPGLIYNKNNKILILLPGPPKEMIPMFENYVIPYLQKFKDEILFSKVLRLCGIGESYIEERILDLIENQNNPTIATYAKEGEVIIRITARARDEKLSENLISPIEKEIKRRLGEYIYGEGETSLEEVVGKLLIEKGLTISIAESCTGGMLTSKLVNCPGISKVLIEGIVVYSNDSKIKRLGVKPETLSKFGAVSKECAIEMAIGIALKSGSKIGLSITGIAGPNGETFEKPIGLVYIGLFLKGEVKSKEYRFSGSRERIRTLATINALNLLRKEIISQQL
ncbi:MAG: competence/damage-inducible protein A [Dictyoglomaceae bacterium]|nr:competence/damage-inducible protein A [Dictyoglomaceae bacterium]